MFEPTWWVLATVPCAFLLQNIIHESSHLIVAVLREGATPLEVRPWPTRYKGRFYWARFTYRRGDVTDPKRLIHIIPMWMGLAMMAFMSVLIFLGAPHIRFTLAPFWLAGLFHVVSFWHGYFWRNPACDGKRYRYGWKGEP